MRAGLARVRLAALFPLTCGRFWCGIDNYDFRRFFTRVVTCLLDFSDGAQLRRQTISVVDHNKNTIVRPCGIFVNL